MQYPLCRHIKSNGTRCKAPSLTTGVHCYFHTRLHQRHSGFRHTPDTRAYLIPGQHIELLPLEDRESVQVALSVVINALAIGQLEPRRATALLYGLQLASANAANLDLNPYAPNVVRTVDSSPEGFDLAEPGAMLEILSPNDETEEDEEDETEVADPEELRCIDLSASIEGSIWPDSRSHSAWGGHFVTCVSPSGAAPVGRRKDSFRRPSGGPGRSRYTRPEVAALPIPPPCTMLEPTMYENFKVTDRWTGEQLHCEWKGTVVAIATRHADATDIRFAVNGRPVWIAMPNLAWVEQKRRTGFVITDYLAAQTAGRYLQHAIQSGYDNGREMYTMTVEEVLEHANAVVKEAGRTDNLPSLPVINEDIRPEDEMGIHLPGEPA